MTTISQEQITAAVRHGHLNMVKQLLEIGIDDINVLNFNDQMPLQGAIENGNENMAKMLKALADRIKSWQIAAVTPPLSGTEDKPSGSL